MVLGPQRNLNLNKEAEKQNNKRVERDLTNLAKAYDGLENVPEVLNQEKVFLKCWWN